MSDSILGRNPDASAKELAVLFTARSAESKGGARYITDKQVNSWYIHRDRTGMPEPCRVRQGYGPACRVWNVEQAWEWFKDYEPAKGGAPKGNQNALRHGRFVGLRAEREARAAARNAA
jgi:hypothetical protein